MTFFKTIRDFIFRKRFNLIEIIASFALIASIILVAAQSQQEKLTFALLAQSSLPYVILTDKIGSSGTAGYSKNYEFTSDWFTPHIPVWMKALESFKGQPEINYLEVGVYEGRATMWMIENILTHPTSTITGMDLFAGEYSTHYGSYEKRYISNLELSGASNRSITIKGYSQEGLRGLALNFFDIIYIDGSHLNADVLEDAVLSWRLLRKSGILIFDDYGGGYTDPKRGIETFVHYFGNNFDIIHNSSQLILKKKPS